MPQHDLVGRNHHDFEAVNLVELSRFGFRRSGHAGQFLVHAEIILEGDGRERLVFALDLDVFLGFDRLVQAVGPAAAGHQAAGKLVDDDDFAVFHHVLDVALVQSVSFDRGIDVVLQVPIFGIGNISDAEKLLDFFPAGVGDRDAPVLLIDDEIAGEFFGFAGAVSISSPFSSLGMMRLTRAYLSVDSSLAPEMISGVRASSIRMESTSSTMAKLWLRCTQSSNVELHVVAQVVESELVVGAVGDVGGVGFAALLIVEIVHDDADSQAEEAVELAHPLRIAFGQVVVDGDDVHAASAERVQIHRQGRDQRLTFTGLHFGNFALMQHHAADQLYVKVAHVEHTAAGFADDGEGFHQELVQDLVDGFGALVVELLEAIGIGVRFVGKAGQTLLDALTEFVGLGAQLVVRELPHLRLESVDGLDLRHQALEFALVLGPEDLT